MINGITGKDGVSLAKFLLDKGYAVYGIHKRFSAPNFWLLQYLDNLEEVKLIPANLVDLGPMVEVIKITEPYKRFNLSEDKMHSIHTKLKEI